MHEKREVDNEKVILTIWVSVLKTVFFSHGCLVCERKKENKKTVEINNKD